MGEYSGGTRVVVSDPAAVDLGEASVTPSIRDHLDSDAGFDLQSFFLPASIHSITESVLPELIEGVRKLVDNTAPYTSPNFSYKVPSSDVLGYANCEYAVHFLGFLLKKEGFDFAPAVRHRLPVNALPYLFRPKDYPNGWDNTDAHTSLMPSPHLVLHEPPLPPDKGLIIDPTYRQFLSFFIHSQEAVQHLYRELPQVLFIDQEKLEETVDLIAEALREHGDTRSKGEISATLSEIWRPDSYKSTPNIIEEALKSQFAFRELAEPWKIFIEDAILGGARKN